MPASKAFPIFDSARDGSRKADPNSIAGQRRANVDGSTFDEKARTIRAVMATETPCPMPDWRLGEMVDEILLMDGARFADQVPLLDSHDDSSILHQVGSTRSLRVEGQTLVGVRHFMDSGELADHAISLIRGGHLRDGSIRYRYSNPIYIDAGGSAVINGRTFTASASRPMRIALEWQLIEDTICAVGADQNAKMRAAHEPEDSIQTKPEISASSAGNQGGFKVNRKLFQLLISRGLALGSTVAEADAYLATLPATEQESLRAESVRPDAPPTPVVDTKKLEADAAARAVEAFRARSKAITEQCRAGQCEQIAQGLIDSNADDLAVARAINAELIRTKPGVGTAITGGDTDLFKFQRAVTDGILSTGGVAVAKPAPGFEDFRHKSLLRIAEMCLEKAGISTRGWNKQQIASAALRMSRYGQRGEYLIAAGTADFTHIVMDASNQSLLQGWNEGPRLWSIIARKGSAPDFKNINRIKLFEAPDLVTINENGQYTEAKFLDSYESYALTSKGLRFTISRKAIINDETGAFTRIPRLLGNSATRAIEKAVFALLTGGLVNTMHDGNAVFSTAHANISTAAALSSTAVQTDLAMMAVQKGQGADGSTVPMGVMGKFLLVPWSQKFAADIICTSAADPTSGLSSAAANVVRAAGIVPLASPFLDMNDTKRRYILADPNAADTLEVSFLDGVDTPFLDEVDQTDADGRVFKVRLDVGAGVLDYPGLLTNAGG